MSADFLPSEIRCYYAHVGAWVIAEIIEEDFVKVIAGGNVDMWERQGEHWYQM